MEHCVRTELLIGNENVDKLRRSHVTIIGLGAVGSYAAEALARAGVGSFRLVDHDRVHASNINRQLFALHSTIGKDKTDVACKRLKDINTQIKVEALNCFAADESFEKIFNKKTNLLIDAIDSVNPKVQLLRYAHENNIPVLTSMGAALRTDIGAIKAGDLFQTKGCPLARLIRKRLRRFGVTKNIFCVYSQELPRKGTYRKEAKKEETARGRKRNILGSLATITGIFGLTLAHYAIEMLCGSLNSK